METIFTTITNIGIFEIERKLKMNNTTDEQWYPVKGYEGYYQVSSQGRVRSLWNASTPKIRTPIMNNGKVCYVLYKLVEFNEIFKSAIETKENTLANKSDEKTLSNIVSSEPKNARQDMIDEMIGRAICRFDKSGNLVDEWKSACDVEYKLGFGRSYITAACKGKYKSAYGYVWKYKDTLLP